MSPEKRHDNHFFVKGVAIAASDMAREPAPPVFPIAFRSRSVPTKWTRKNASGIGSVIR